MNLLDLASAALAAFEARATDPTPATEAEQPEPEPPGDPFPPLPTCEQCANLGQQRDSDGFRRCAAAARGELPHIASRRYSPVPDIGRRCEGFAPKPEDPDQQPGHQRWPGLIQERKGQ